MQNDGLRKRIIRLGRILKYFLEKDKVYSKSLAEQFETNIRTIQRDLDILKKSGFALFQEGQGCYRMDKNLFKQYEAYNDTELALIVATKNILQQLGPAFQDAADSVFNSLYKSIGDQPPTPIFVKIDEPVLLDPALINRIAKALRDKRTVAFEYIVYSPYEVNLEPYKIAYFEGLWYLIGKDLSSGKLKSYALDKMKKFRLLKDRFRGVPDNLDEMLESSINVWFSPQRNIEIEVLVDAECAKHFKRRKIFPTQEIKKENDDGSIIVTFKVGSFEEIRTMLQKWLPYIKILRPKECRKELLESMKEWFKWQSKPLKPI